MNRNALALALCASGFCALASAALYLNGSSSRLSSSGAASVGADIKADRTIELGKAQSIHKKTSTEAQVIFNDPAMSEKWDLKKSGADKAWELSTGSREIRVAVIDTGIQKDHEDLRANIWKNPGETGKDKNGKDKATNGIDDDGNGLTDDVHGWNFVENNNDLTDNHGHGSHIAGIIGAEGGNGKGISGLAPKVSMMVLKYYDPKHTSTDNLKNTIKAIHYAIKMKAHIINYSGGGTDFSKEEYEAVKKAKEAGILFVAAAGNERSNSDKHSYYPADYDLDNIISVTAIDSETKVLASSNYGIKTVDIAAPGKNILSTLPNGSYGYMTGTSQATAFVSGASAVILAHKKGFTSDDVRKYILNTGDKYLSLAHKTGTSRKLNLFRALTILDRDVTLTGAKEVTAQSKAWNTYLPGRSTAGEGNKVSEFSKSLLQHLGAKAETVELDLQ